MSKAPDSTIELTMENNQVHRSQIIHKGRRQPQRDSSRPRSVKERQDALKKLKLYRKRNQKEKKFSNKIIYINKKEIPKSKIKTSTKISSKHQKQAKEDKKAKTSTDLQPVKEQKRQHELESHFTSSLSIDDHHPDEKQTHKNDTTPNSNSFSAIFSHDDDSTSTLKTSKVNALRFNRQHSSNTTDQTRTKDNVNEDVTNSNDEENAKTDTVTLTASSCTDTTVMDTTTDCITSKSELNGLNTEDAVEESKKNNCIWWSIASGIGGFILLFTVYYYGTSMLQDKYKQDIENYMNQLPLEKIYWINFKSIDTSFKLFEVFNKQNTDTKYTWISQFKRKTIFEVKLEEKYREKIDELFQKYTQQMTIQYVKKDYRNSYDVISLAAEFIQLEYFYELKINYTPLAKYFQQKKAKLKGNKEMIPAQVTLSGFTDDGYFKLNGRYEIQSFDDYSHTPVYVRAYDSYVGYQVILEYNDVYKTWRIKIGYTSHYVEWKNTENVSHPGQLKPEEAMYVEKVADKKTETPIPQLKMTTQLFLHNKSLEVTKT